MIVTTEVYDVLEILFERRPAEGHPAVADAIKAGLVVLDKDGLELTADGLEIYRFARQLAPKAKTKDVP